MTATKTKAEYVYSIVDEFWPVPEDLQHPNPSEAVSAAREVESVLFDRMEIEGLPRAQSLCLLVCATKSGKFHPLLLGKELAAFITEKEWEPVAIAFAIMDVEKKHDIMLQTRVFESSERTARILAEIQTHLALEIKAKFSRKAN